MDLTTLWQEQKTFILCVLGGLLVFFLGQAVISTLYGVDENKRRVASLEAGLRRTAAPNRVRLEAARERNEVLQGRYDEALENVTFRPDERYLLSKSEKPDIQYDRLFNEARDSLVEGAKTLNISVDDRLGMPELSPTRRSEIQHALTALDIVTRVVLLAIESQVSEVQSISMVPDRGQRKKRTLREQQIKFQMTGSITALSEFLRRFALQEDFLAIVAARFEADDTEGARIEAEFTVAALEIIKEEAES